MELSTLLQAFSKKYGLGDCQMNNNGVCTLQVKDNRQLNIERSDDARSVFFSAPLCRLPADEQRVNLFDHLMQAHAYGIGTDNAYFAASPQIAEAILCKRLELDQTDEDCFCAALESFIKTHAYWAAEADSGRLFAPVASTDGGQNVVLTQNFA